MNRCQPYLDTVAAIICALLTIAGRSNAQNLQATVTLDASGRPVWNYTLTNDEPAASTNWLTSFYLPISAPVTNVLSPNGWFVDTDFTSYVLWSNIEPSPYPHDIPPGVSVSGFQFESTATSGRLVGYTIASWNHVADDTGPSVVGQILAPTVVRECESLTALPSALVAPIGMALYRCRRKWRATWLA